MGRYVLAIDQGTTSSRALLFDADCRVAGLAQREFTQHFPRSGWVEHDAEEIWAGVVATAREAVAQAGGPANIVAIGISNQRETSVIWDRCDGAPDPQRHRLAGPAHGGRVRGAACGGTRARPSPTRPGCGSIRISRPPKSPGSSTTSPARAPAPSAASSPSAPSIAFCCGG